MNSKKLPTLEELLSIEIPKGISVDDLREALIQINKHEVDKNIPIDDAVRYASSLGIPSETPRKYLGIILLNWIEKLSVEHKTEEGLAGNTVGDLAEKIERYENRLKQKKEIRDDSKRIIDAAIKKKKSIQEELDKTRAAENELKGKRLYASVKVEEQTKLNEKEEAVDIKLANDTIDADKRTAEINKLSKEFEQQLSIKDVREREIAAHAAIVGIIAQVHNPNLDHKINSEILKAVANSSSLSALIGGSDILELTKSGSIALSLNENAQQATSRQAAIFLYGEKVATYLFGPETIEVEISNSPHSDSSHVVDLGRLNINHQVLLKNQLQILEVVSQSDNPTATVYTRIISDTKDDELKIDTSKTKRVSDTERISELIKRTSPKNVSGDFSFKDIEVSTWVKDVLPENSNVHTLAEKTTGQGLASTAVSILTQHFGSKVVGNVATKGFFAKILPKLFGVGGPLAWLGAEAVSWIVQWLAKNQDKIPYILGGAVGLGTLPFLGLGTALLVGGTTFVIVGGVGATSLLASSFISGLNLFWRLIVLPPLKGFLFGFLAITVFTAFVLFIINSGAYVVPPTPIGKNIIHIPSGGNMTKCDPEETGEDITEQLASSVTAGSVQLLPDSAASRQEGLCITPTMIVLHSSGGYDNDDGNIRTYETLVSRQAEASCQMATDTNDTIFMLSFFENKVENAWCQHDLNDGGVGIELAGEFKADSPDSSNHGAFSKCSPEGSLMFTPDGPHPCAPLEDLAFDAVCKVMQQYSIPWTQVFQHEDAKLSPKEDPIGDEWVNKFITRLKNNCTIKQNDEVR